MQVEDKTYKVKMLILLMEIRCLSLAVDEDLGFLTFCLLVHHKQALAMKAQIDNIWLAKVVSVYKLVFD